MKRRCPNEPTLVENDGCLRRYCRAWKDFVDALSVLTSKQSRPMKYRQRVSLMFHLTSSLLTLQRFDMRDTELSMTSVIRLSGRDRAIHTNSIVKGRRAVW